MKHGGINTIEYYRYSLMLLLQMVKDYLFSFTLTESEKVEMKPFSPNLLKKANKIITSIHKISPRLRPYLIGSVGFQILGQGDIDILVACPSTEFINYLPQMGRLFGSPIRIRGSHIEWEMYSDSTKIECMLIDPKTSLFRSQITLFESIKNNPRLLKRYIEIKKSINHLPVQVYVRRRMKFFNEVLWNNRNLLFQNFQTAKL